MQHGSPRILIIRLSSIGDVVRALPVLQVLREAYRAAQIDWAVERKSAAVLDGHPYLDNLLIFERSPGRLRAAGEFFSFCQRIRSSRYDIALDLHGIFKSGLIAGFSGAPDRFGFARPRSREASHLFTNRKVKLSSMRLNRAEENLTLCEAVVSRPGAASAHRLGWPPAIIEVSHEIRAQVGHFFEETFDSGKVVIAVHVPVGRPEKQWPMDYFAALCDLLLADGRYDVMLTWGPGQIGLAQEVAAMTRRKPIVAPETPNLKHYAWLIHLSSLYFGGDTGPMHIASAMGTPVVAVFGGTDPAKHAPYRHPYEVLYTPEGETSPSPDAEERLRRITPEMAYDACIRVLTCAQGNGSGLTRI